MDLRKEITGIFRVVRVNRPAIAEFFLFFAAIMAIVLVTRSATGSKPYDSDAYGYDQIARAYIGQGSPEDLNKDLYTSRDAYREPLYPLFLALVYRVGGVSSLPITVVQAALLAWFLVRFRYFLKRRISGWISVLATLFLIIAPGFIFSAGQILGETLFTVLLGAAVLWFIEAVERKSELLFFLSGISLSLATGTRSISFLLPIAFIMVIFVLWHYGQFTLHSVIRCSAIFLCSAYIISFGWIVRNYFRYGAFHPVSSMGGMMMAVHAEKSRLSTGDFMAYGMSVLLGDFLAERKFPHYAEKKYVIEQNDFIGAFEWGMFKKGMSDYDRDQWFRHRALESFLMGPSQYFLDNFLVVLKLNTPMQYNQSSLRRLFGTAPFSWPRLAMSIIVRLIMYAAIGCIAYGLWRAIVSGPLAFRVLAIPPIYMNAILSFFDGVPRYIIPVYPFYAFFGVMGMMAILRKFSASHDQRIN